MPEASIQKSNRMGKSQVFNFINYDIFDLNLNDSRRQSIFTLIHLKCLAIYKFSDFLGIQDIYSLLSFGTPQLI